MKSANYGTAVSACRHCVRLASKLNRVGHLWLANCLPSTADINQARRHSVSASVILVTVINLSLAPFSSHRLENDTANANKTVSARPTKSQRQWHSLCCIALIWFQKSVVHCTIGTITACSLLPLPLQIATLKFNLNLNWAHFGKEA